jgi:hypothetical protein
MSIEFVSTMSLEYCVSYVPERFSGPMEPRPYRLDTAYSGVTLRM